MSSRFPLIQGPGRTRGTSQLRSRNITLTEHFEQFLEDQLRSSRCKDANEVPRAGLRLLEHQIQADVQQLSRLKSLTEAGFRVTVHSRLPERETNVGW